MKSIIEQIDACKSDAQKWELILSNKDSIVIKLDNDSTYISDSKTNEYVKFRHCAGQSIGLITLLEVIGINSEYV